MDTLRYKASPRLNRRPSAAYAKPSVTSMSSSGFIPFHDKTDDPSPNLFREKVEEVSIYQKVAHHLRLAVAQGGSTNPKYNLQLARAVKMAHEHNVMPDTIRRIIRECKVERDIQKSSILQIRYKKKVFIVCVVFTTDLLALKNNIFKLLKKHGAAFSYAMHMFNSCGMVEAIMSYRTAVEFNNIEGALARDALRCKATSVEVVDYETGAVNFKCTPHKLPEVCEAVKERSYKIMHTEYGFQPKTEIALPLSEYKDYKYFMSKLREFREIDKIFDNVRENDSIYFMNA